MLEKQDIKHVDYNFYEEGQIKIPFQYTMRKMKETVAQEDQKI